MKKLDIKAVEMTREIRDAHYERFKGKPIRDRIAYYKARAHAFDEEIARMHEQERKDKTQAQ